MIDFAKRVLRKLHRPRSYGDLLRSEINTFKDNTNVHDLPKIFAYWGDKYLTPKFQEIGFENAVDLYQRSMIEACQKNPDQEVRFLSLGAGNCDLEVQVARFVKDSICSNFVLECVELNPHMIERGVKFAAELEVSDHIAFCEADLNTWKSEHSYQVIIANHILHHIVELEHIFDSIYDSLADDGVFVVCDMIGKNGHGKWPEALQVVEEYWQKMPKTHRRHCITGRIQKSYINPRPPVDDFEGIRAQEILPLLNQSKFHFHLFMPYSNIIDPFIDRATGHNFDPEKEWDRGFIDEIAKLDWQLIESGKIKPCQMIAILGKKEASSAKFYKNLTPEFCERKI